MPDEPPSLLERKLATILSADVAGYSRLMAENEEETLRVFRGHRQVIDSLVAMHRGRIFNTAGDAILAEFPSAVEAVRCATEIQTALHTRNDQLPPGRQVKFRIGVNLGDVMVQGSDLLGDGVNVASRIQAAAEPGGICISGSVYDQIRNKLSLSFKSLGERSFKNIPQPVRTFSITETEDHGALPAHRADARKILKWAALPTLLVLIAVGGYLGYVTYRNGIDAERRAARQAIERAEARAQAEEKIARDAETARFAELARQQAAAEARRREVEARRFTDMQRLGEAQPPAGPQSMPPARAAETPGTTAPAVAAATPSPGNTPRTPNTSGKLSMDGMYAGPVCMGEARFEAARCYRAQAAVTQGKVSGQWPAREPDVAIYVWGEISGSGDVTIHIQTRKADGSPMATANLTGTMRDGRLDATGTFLNGRSVQLNWQKN